MHSCVCSDTASTACLCVHSLVCQRSQEGRGVQYLQPGFMAVDIPILTCTHAVNPIVHPKCLQWNGLGAHIPMAPPFTTWLWIWPVVHLVMCVMTSHYYIPLCHGNWLKLLNVPPWPPQLFNPVSQCPSPCECATPLRTSCVCEAVMFIFMYVLKCWTVLYMQLPWWFAYIAEPCVSMCIHIVVEVEERWSWVN